jgi:penicillin-binding protein 1A
VRLPEPTVMNELLGGSSSGMVEHFYQEFPPPDTSAAGLGADQADPGTPIPPATAPPGTPL